MEKPTASRRRVGAETRRRQIITATLRLVGQYGLQGTTVSRVAGEVGVSEMALYRHFENKEAMLVAAHEYLLERATEWMTSSSHPWVPSRLREIGWAHFEMLTSDMEMWTAPQMQFVMSRSPKFHAIAAFAEDGRLLDGQATPDSPPGTSETLAQYLREGQKQGSIRPDVDIMAFALEWMSWAQGENLHYLAANGGEFNREPHLRLLDLIIADIELPQG